MIPQLVAEWEKGYKIVCAVKKQSKENRFVRFLRTIYYKLVRKLSSVRQIEHFTGTGLYDRSFVDVLAGLDDPAAVFCAASLPNSGLRSSKFRTSKQRRRAGKTSNNFSTLYDAAMLSFTTYTKAPIRCFTLIGLALAALSLLGAIVFGILAGVGYVNFLLGVIVCVIAFLLSGAYIRDRHSGRIRPHAEKRKFRTGRSSWRSAASLRYGGREGGTPCRKQCRRRAPCAARRRRGAGERLNQEEPERKKKLFFKPPCRFFAKGGFFYAVFLQIARIPRPRPSDY